MHSLKKRAREVVQAVERATTPIREEVAALRREVQTVTHDYQQLAAVLEHSPDGVLTLTPDGTIKLVNRTFERLTGWPRAAALGRRAGDLLDPRDGRGRPLDAIATLLDGPRPGDSRYLEGSVVTHGGDRLPVGFALAALRDPAGGLREVVLSLRDRRLAESAEVLRSEFVGVLSHELQTPLAIIKGYASTLAREDAHWDPEQLREGLAVIEDEADRLSRLVDDLLAVSRIQALGLTAERTPTDLSAVTARLAARFQAAHPEHRIVTEAAPGLPMILADQEKLETVLRNLLDNATKYAPAGSTVTVRVGRSADHRQIRVSVGDEGPGIPAGERTRVFDRFYRVDNRDTRESRGAGLGLFLCRTIVQAHGGDIWVEDAPGPGATVTFTVPIE